MTRAVQFLVDFEVPPRVNAWMAIAALASALAASSIAVVSLHRLAGIADAAHYSSRVACERTREFAPLIARDYARRHVLVGDQMRDYLSTIPKSCPR